MDQENIKILADEIELDPTFEFVQMSEVIKNLITSSKPHFTIGIHGEWGTGKTTLMNLINSKIAKLEKNEKKRKIVPVWFNAWRYEREEHYATIALMKTIAYAIAEHEQFNVLSKKILRGIKIIGKELIKTMSTTMLATNLDVNEIEKKLDERMNFLDKFDKDTIYFDGLKQIKDEMNKIQKEINSQYRIVVFIDDLDRCSPSNALEVLESIKVFLDMEGFVYVLGLNRKTISDLINTTMNYDKKIGEQYIKKIIQIPIDLPPWTISDLSFLIENQIANELGKHADFIKDHKDLITPFVELSPRELKRFINRVIITAEIFFGKGVQEGMIDMDELLIVEIISTNWHDFYKEFVTDDDFFKIFSGILFITHEEKGMRIEKIKQLVNNTKEHKNEIEKIGEKFYKQFPKLQGKSDEITKLGEEFFASMMNKQQLLKDVLLTSINNGLLSFILRDSIYPIFKGIDWEYYRKVRSTSVNYFSTQESSNYTTTKSNNQIYGRKNKSRKFR